MSPTLEYLKDKKKVKRMLTHYENMPKISPNRRSKEFKINDARLQMVPKIVIEKIEEDEEEKDVQK